MCAFSELSCLCVVSRNRKTQDSQTTTSASNCFEGGEIRKHSVNVLFWAFFFSSVSTLFTEHKYEFCV